MTDRDADLEQLKKTVEVLQTQLDQLQRQTSKHEANTTVTLDAAAKLERLNFYRREDAQEWTLLTNRVNSYIMSQAFLVSAYAASMSNPDLRFRLLFPIVVSGIGLIASARAYPGIEGACKIIQLWHKKKEDILTDPCLSDFCDGRQHNVPLTPYRRMVRRLVARSKIGHRARMLRASGPDCVPPNEQDTSERVDQIHTTSLYFAQSAPKLFGSAWIVLLGLALTLHFVH